MAIIDFDPKTMAEISAMQQTMETIKNLGATVRAAELNAKKRDEDQNTNNAQILRWLAEGNSRSEKKVQRDFVSMGEEDAKKIADEYVNNVGPALQRRAEAAANMIAKKPGKSLEDVAKDVANKIAADGLLAAMEMVKKIISERIEQGVDYTGKQVEDLSEPYKEQKQREHQHIYPIGNATGQVIDNLAPGKRNVRLTRK